MLLFLLSLFCLSVTLMLYCCILINDDDEEMDELSKFFEEREKNKR